MTIQDAAARDASVHPLPTPEAALAPLADRLEDALHARFPGMADRTGVAMSTADGAVEVRLTGVRLTDAESLAARDFLAGVTGAARRRARRARAHHGASSARVLDLAAHRRPV